ncbi:NAD(P)-dependent oxidoreductase [Candidatus Pelagibacter sp.]|jgi:GDP-L-fucose synthase|nr:NAD(P)-dependent oxidoreductase [Candidatus Pelagibacter sp.]
MKNIFKNKNILIAGGTGMVGIPLSKKLYDLGANIYIASLDKMKSDQKKIVRKFYKLDLINVENCLKVTKNKDIVFNLLGVTGSPQINYSNPGSFMMSNLYCAVNLLYASQKNNVKRYLYTSTYGVYGKSLKMKEENVWKTFPSEHDKYAGWAKRMGELQVEAYQKEYNFDGLHIVRPANIYGPNLNYNPKNSMVVASLIKRILDKENPLKVWGDGSNIRDFIYCDDVASAMINVVKKNIKKPINIGSGKGVSIKQLIKKIINSKFVKNKPKIVYDLSKNSGDKKRVLITKFAEKNGIINKTSLKDGIDQSILWYLENKKFINNFKYNQFKKKK